MSRQALREVETALGSARLFLKLLVLFPWHFSDRVIAEDSPTRLMLLKMYSRIEVQLLRVMYRLCGLKLMQSHLARVAFYWLGGKYVMERGVVGTIKTRDEMLQFIDALPDDSRIAVGPCRCRLATRACSHPLETDIVILTGAPIWLDVFPRDYRPIDKAEAARIVRESYEAGLVPMLDRHLYFRGNANYFVICNCCGCSCLQIIGYRFLKEAGFRFIPSTFEVRVDTDKCEGCGTCIEACAFGERAVISGKAIAIDCQGCGQCVRVCPNGANSLFPRAT